MLSLDADEEASPELHEEITATIADPQVRDAYAIRRRNVFLGRWMRYGGLYPDWQVRLFRRGCGRFVERAVHESVIVEGTRCAQLSNGVSLAGRRVLIPLKNMRLPIKKHACLLTGNLVKHFGVLSIL